MIWIVFLLAIGLVALFLWSQRQISELSMQLSRQNSEISTYKEKLLYAEQVQDWLMNAIDGAIVLLNSSQVVVMANPAAIRLAGNPMVGDTFIAALRHNVLDELVQQSLQMSEDEISDRVVEIKGSIFQLRIRKVKHQQHVFQLITMIDISALKRAERARRDMVANISHELRTPITTIGLLAETLEDDEVRRSKQGRKMIGSIRRELDTLTQIVQEMRDLSRIEQGQMIIKMTENPLKEIVLAGTEPLMALAESKNQVITVEVASDTVVLADRFQVERIVKNIVHNAIKFTPPEGKIHVKTQVADAEATIMISDNGIGIPAEDVSRIFERFFQVDRSRKDGTGLGLAIARHIVIAHGGKIWVESEEGAGTRFLFTLPLATKG